MDRALPFSVARRGVQDLLRRARGDVLRYVQDGRVALADDLVRLVAVEAPRAFVPQKDVAVEVLADHRVFGGGLEDVRDEIDGAVGIADQAGIEEFRRDGPVSPDPPAGGFPAATLESVPGMRADGSVALIGGPCCRRRWQGPNDVILCAAGNRSVHRCFYVCIDELRRGRLSRRDIGTCSHVLPPVRAGSRPEALVAKQGRTGVDSRRIVACAPAALDLRESAVDAERGTVGAM